MAAIDDVLAALISAPQTWFPGGRHAQSLRRLGFLGAVDTKVERPGRWGGRPQRLYRANRHTKQYLAATHAQRQYLGRNGGFVRRG